MTRIWIGLVAIVVALSGWMQQPAAAAASAAEQVHAYAYDAHGKPAAATYTVTERGPPAGRHDHTSQPSVGDHGSRGALARLQLGSALTYTAYDHPARLVQVDSASGTSRTAADGTAGDVRAVSGGRVAANAGSGLSDDVVGLAERNITNSGDTVLGHFPGYIAKANSKGASYFDIGDAWNGLTPAQRWSANTHFLDTRIAAGDRVLLSVPKGDIRPGSYLAQEVQHLTSNGYRWTNQWSLVPRG